MTLNQNSQSDDMEIKFNNLEGQFEQSSLQIKSYRLQYMLLFICLIFIVYLTVRAYYNPYPFLIEYLILVATIIVTVYHMAKKFI